MATTQITNSLPPKIDIAQAQQAFGNIAIRKLNQELKDLNLTIRQQALMTLCNLMHDPEKVYEAISTGCVTSLTDLLTDFDDTIRNKASEAISIAASHNVGRDALLEEDVIPHLAMLFNDEVVLVRRNAHHAIKTLVEFPYGANGVVEAGLIPKLVEHVQSEDDKIKHVILSTLHFAARIAPIRVLKANVMQVLNNLLSSEHDLVRCAAARLMMDVCVPHIGKKLACEDTYTMAQLVELLMDCSNDVKANAAGAIMTIAVTTQGKYAALNAGCLPHLLHLINSPKTEVRLNVIKALTMLGETPEGRAALRRGASDIVDRTVDQASKAVSQAAKIALRIIRWKP